MGLAVRRWRGMWRNASESRLTSIMPRRKITNWAKAWNADAGRLHGAVLLRLDFRPITLPAHTFSLHTLVARRPRYSFCLHSCLPATRGIGVAQNTSPPLAGTRAWFTCRI